MPTAHLNGLRFHYLDEGTGPPLLLLHGLGSTARDWEFQFHVYSKHFRVIAPDLRGFGATQKKGPYRIDQFAKDAWALLAQLGIDEFSLVGYSMGGAVALEMAAEQPSRVTRMVITNSVPSFRPTHWSHWWMLGYRYVIMALLGPRMLASRTTAHMFPRPEHAELRRRNAQRAARNSRWVYLGSLWGLTKWSVVEKLESLAMPVLVIAADNDYFSREEIVRFAHALPLGRLHIFKDSHHGLPQEYWEAFNAVTLKFLEGRDRRLAHRVES
jgi:3-oxoadipate enol-lactonase